MKSIQKVKKLLEILIGSLKVKFKELKIKVNVDLVGLSPPLPLLNLSKLSVKEPSEISLNNNSLIALNPTEITDVEVVLWTMVSLISEITVSVPKNLMDILLKMVPVKLPHVLNHLSPFLVIMMSMELMVLKKPVTNNQSLLLLMPKNGLSIPVVSSPTVELLLITVSSLLVILLNLVS